MANKRYTIATTLKTGLKTILTNNGFRTNAGRNVFFGYKAPTNVAKDRMPAILINLPTEEIKHYSTCEKERNIFIDILLYTHGTQDEDLFENSHKLLEDVIQYLLVNERLNGVVDTESDLSIENYMVEPFNVSMVSFNYNYVSLYKAA